MSDDVAGSQQMGEKEPPLVLVVEDETDLADLYAAWLDDEYRVRTVYGGREALDRLDEDVDVVLLDRRMPGLSGDDVLAAIRERGIDCRVAMVTAVEPDFDIVEMGFDDYLVKPVDKESLGKTVERLVQRNEYDAGVQELFALSSKRALLEAEKGQAALASSEEYQDLSDRIESLQSDLDATMASFGDHGEFERLFQGLGSNGDGNDDE